MKQKIQIIILFYFVTLTLISCNSNENLYDELKKNRNEFDKIIMYLSDSILMNKIDTLLSVRDLQSISQIKPTVDYLIRKKLLSNNANFGNKCFYYKNRYCITFFVRQESSLLKNNDYLLMYEDLVPLLSGLGTFYNINQDEHISSLNINVKECGGLNFVSIKYNRTLYND